MLDAAKLICNRSGMATDPFSSILSFMNARTVAAGGFTAGGNWSLRFPPPEKIKFFVMAKGRSLVLVEGIDTPFEMRQGDVFLLRAGLGFVIASDLETPSLDALELYDLDRPEVIDLGGDDVLFLGGHVDLDSQSENILLNQIPPTIQISAGQPEAIRLAWLIEQFVREQVEAAPGSDQACSAIAQLMILDILRAYIATAADIPNGWLRALGDRKLQPALMSIHSNPAGGWSVDALARISGMSRTGFAVHFKAVVGVAPLTYLTTWRMQVASRGLRDGITIASVAPAVGYSSEAAFSTAFKRVSGMAPKAYRLAASKLDAKAGDQSLHLDLNGRNV